MIRSMNKGENDLEVQNALANRIDTAGEMSSYDEACKQILSNRIILAWILKHCMKEFAEYSIEDIEEKYTEGKIGSFKIICTCG